MGNFKIVFIII